MKTGYSQRRRLRTTRRSPLASSERLVTSPNVPGFCRPGRCSRFIPSRLVTVVAGSSTAANVIGGTAGAVAGGAAGNAIEGSQRTNGVEITIRLDSGEMVAVVQPGDPRDFRRGDRVRVSGYGDSVRVTR